MDKMNPFPGLNALLAFLSFFYCKIQNSKPYVHKEKEYLLKTMLNFSSQKTQKASSYNFSLKLKGILKSKV